MFLVNLCTKLLSVKCSSQKIHNHVFLAMKGMKKMLPYKETSPRVDYAGKLPYADGLDILETIKRIF